MSKHEEALALALAEMRADRDRAVAERDEARATARENKWYAERRDEEIAAANDLAAQAFAERDEAVAALRSVMRLTGDWNHPNADIVAEEVDEVLARLSDPKAVDDA